MYPKCRSILRIHGSVKLKYRILTVAITTKRLFYHLRADHGLGDQGTVPDRNRNCSLRHRVQACCGSRLAAYLWDISRGESDQYVDLDLAPRLPSCGICGWRHELRDNGFLRNVNTYLWANWHSSSSLELHSEGSGFESRMRHRPSWLMGFVVFLRLWT
jgi:hypothetical protein